MKVLRFIFSLRFAAILVGLSALLLLSTRLFSFSLSEDSISSSFGELEYSPEHHYYQYQGERMHYVTCGDSSAIPLLMVHGSPGSWDNFVKFVTEAEVLNKFFIIAVDRPGYGDSQNKELRSLSQQSKALKQIIENHFHDEEGYLLGHSYGGAVCLQLATDYSEQFKGMLLAAGTLADIYQKPRWYNYAVRYTPVGWLLNETFKLSNREMWRLPEDLQSLYPDLSKLDMKIAMLQGGRDFLVDPATPDYLFSQLPNGQTRVFYWEDMDHFLIWNDLDKIESALAWLTEV